MLVGAIALTVVMVMQVVGLIMVIALLTIPAAIAGQFVKDLKQMMLYSSYLGIIFTTVGLWLSYTWDLTSGATIFQRQKLPLDRLQIRVFITIYPHKLQSFNYFYNGIQSSSSLC